MRHHRAIPLRLAGSLAIAAVPGVCSAQGSNAQIYGVLDVGAAYVTNAQGKASRQLAVRHESSFWGVRGREDLGGGLSASFQYERSIAVDTGNDGVRSALVGLSSKTWGTITLGRQYDLFVDHVQTDPARQNSINAITPGNYDRSLGNYLDNSIKYKSPAFGHVVFGAMVAAPEGAAFSAGKAVGLNAMYQTPGTRVVATVLDLKGTTVRPFNDLGIGELFGVTFNGDRTRSVVINQRISGIGAYHDIGGWRLLGNVSHAQLTAVASDRKESYRSVRLGAFTPVKKGLKLGFGTSVTTMADSRWVNLHAIATYVLSPRTEIYVRGVTQRASGPSQKAALFIEGPSSTHRQSAIGAGLTHRF